MWEYRLVWDSQPEWWPSAWRHGTAQIERVSQTVEARTDLYLAIRGRADVGVKLRGGGGLEVKLLHQRRDGWELWEKVVIERWDYLEAARLCVALALSPPLTKPQKTVTPIEGAEALLKDFGISAKRVEVQKKRFQAAAGLLLEPQEGWVISPEWLAELVEIRTPARAAPLLSLCLETMRPSRDGVEPVGLLNGIRCGYPELLLRQE